MTNLSLTIVEVIVLQLGAIVLGIAIHFFVVSRRGLKFSASEKQKANKQLDEWKLKYFNDMEAKEREVNAFKETLAEVEERYSITEIESDELRKQNRKLTNELDMIKRSVPEDEKVDYITSLRVAQTSLAEHNEKISLLLEQLNIATEVEVKQQDILREKEELQQQIIQLRYEMNEKEKEIVKIRQKEHLTKEMNSMLDNAYSEFSVLQNKIQKLEAQVASSRQLSVEFEDLREEYHKQAQEVDTLRIKVNVLSTENQQIVMELRNTEDKLRESNFHRQQLQKRVNYLEELNNDLQIMADSNKKLEGQLKRIGELESLLNVTEEERDILKRKHSL